MMDVIVSTLPITPSRMVRVLSDMVSTYPCLITEYSCDTGTPIRVDPSCMQVCIHCGTSTISKVLACHVYTSLLVVASTVRGVLLALLIP